MGKEKCVWAVDTTVLAQCIMFLTLLMSLSLQLLIL